jgi:hypothetical protein
MGPIPKIPCFGPEGRKSYLEISGKHFSTLCGIRPFLTVWCLYFFQNTVFAVLAVGKIYESVFPKTRKEKTSLVFFLNRTFDKI